jgi:hypothetical protein
MRRAASFIIAAVGILAFGVAAPATATPQASHLPFCGITWGSLAKVDPDMSAAQMVDVRAGRHACFDRLVLDYFL